LEQLREMRRRLSQGGSVYTAGMRAFLSGLWQQSSKTEESGTEAEA
jgi:hypothetical protein